ncbi:MAG: cytochrome P450 [Hydrococcus sp. Prado102]|jgi:cytochrome P450|nr:cytochrome P450 [Hydrococcus sp. Prado102]
MTLEETFAFLPFPPGNLGLPIIGETLSFLGDSQFAVKRHQKYGSIFKTRLFGQPMLYIYEAEANRFVLTNEENYFVNSLPPSTEALLGSFSLATQTDTEHKSRRQILYQAFQPRALAAYFSTITDITQTYLERWVRKETLTWYPELQNYTFDLACKFLVGLDNASATPLRPLYETWGAGLFTFNTLRLPWTKFGRAWRSRQQILDQIEKIIRERQQQLNLGSDALGILLQARDEEGNSISLDELKSQILGLLFAGHGSLTSALASFCLLVAQHPEVLAKVRAEQKQFDTDEPLTPEQLKQMVYLDQVLKEVLRVIPPIGGGFRKAIKDCEFKGYRIPKGWSIIYQITLTHKDSQVYFEPEEFAPERFNPHRAEDKRKPFGYVPFGGGLRECIGKEFARLEMKVFAAMLVRGYDWELLPNQNLEMDIMPIPRPRDGLQVNIRRLSK